MMSKRGFVLVCVLWVLAILTVVTLGFGRRSMLDRRAASYSLDHTQAMMMARGAVNRGIAQLRYKLILDAVLNTNGVTLVYLGQPWAQPIDMLGEKGLFTLGEEFQDDEVSCRIVDVEGFISLNSAPEKLLDGVKSLSRTAIRKIMARRAGQEEGTEGPCYFQTIEEVRYLGGVDEDDWFGSKRKSPLYKVLTTWGDGKVNVNTAPEEVLNCLPELGKASVKGLLRYRNGPDGEPNTADDRGLDPNSSLAAQTGMNDHDLTAMRTYCKFTSNCFKITGTATRRKGTVRAVCSAVVNAGGTVLAWREETLGS